MYVADEITIDRTILSPWILARDKNSTGIRDSDKNSFRRSETIATIARLRFEFPDCWKSISDRLFALNFYQLEI